MGREAALRRTRTPSLALAPMGRTRVATELVVLRSWRGCAGGSGVKRIVCCACWLNACCLACSHMRLGTTVAQIQNQLFGCLQQMWDEGIGLADNAGFTSANGHWYNMRSTSNTWASCSFAFTSDGGLWMNQDFFSASSGTACSCPGAGGTSDSCGGTCYGAGAPACSTAYTQGGYTVNGCGANTASGTACTATCAAQFAGTVGGTVSCSSGAYTGGKKSPFFFFVVVVFLA